MMMMMMTTMRTREVVVVVAEETKWQTPVRVEERSESKTAAEQRQRDVDRSAELVKLKEAAASERKLAESERRHSYQQQQSIDKLEKKLKEKELLLVVIQCVLWSMHCSLVLQHSSV